MQASVTGDAGYSEVAILGRVLTESQELTPELARHLLSLRFSPADQARMTGLVEKNKSEQLTDAEQQEMLGYDKAGCLLGVLHSKARQCLRKPNHRL